MTKAKIISIQYRRMEGKELRRLRVLAEISQRGLAGRCGWYKKKIQRMEKSAFFDLQAQDMQILLTALGASSI